MYCFNLLWIPVGSILVVYSSKECDLRSFHITLLLVENKPVFLCYSHQLVQPSVMLSIIFAMHNNVISETNDSFTAGEELVYHLLEDVLGAGKSEW